MVLGKNFAQVAHPQVESDGFISGWYQFEDEFLSPEVRYTSHPPLTSIKLGGRHIEIDRPVALKIRLLDADEDRHDWCQKKQHSTKVNLNEYHTDFGDVEVAYSFSSPQTHIFFDGYTIHTDAFENLVFTSFNATARVVPEHVLPSSILVDHSMFNRSTGPALRQQIRSYPSGAGGGVLLPALPAASNTAIGNSSGRAIATGTATGIATGTATGTGTAGRTSERKTTTTAGPPPTSTVLLTSTQMGGPGVSVTKMDEQNFMPYQQTTVGDGVGVGVPPSVSMSAPLIGIDDPDGHHITSKSVMTSNELITTQSVMWIDPQTSQFLSPMDKEIYDKTLFDWVVEDGANFPIYAAAVPKRVETYKGYVTEMVPTSEHLNDCDREMIMRESYDIGAPVSQVSDPVSYPPTFPPVRPYEHPAFVWSYIQNEMLARQLRERELYRIAKMAAKEERRLNRAAEKDYQRAIQDKQERHLARSTVDPVRVFDNAYPVRDANLDESLTYNEIKKRIHKLQRQLEKKKMMLPCMPAGTSTENHVPDNNQTTATTTTRGLSSSNMVYKQCYDPHEAERAYAHLTSMLSNNRTGFCGGPPSSQRGDMARGDMTRGDMMMNEGDMAMMMMMRQQEDDSLGRRIDDRRTLEGYPRGKRQPSNRRDGDMINNKSHNTKLVMKLGERDY